jgi:cyclopropane fatty-acyl-phospholipid synthase-like methyltransferase
LITVETDYPVATDSVDHIHPRGTKQDNTHCPKFIDLLTKDHKPRYMDLGCAGGGLVKEFHDVGCVAVGVEGSDYGRNSRFGEWATIPENLFTADLTKSFQVFQDNKPLLFDVITAWEVLEHIPEACVPQMLENIRKHLSPTAFFMGSISRGTDTYEGVEYHCTVQQPDWWEIRFEQAGLIFDQEMYDYVEPDWPRGTTGSMSFPVCYRLKGAL